MSKARSIPSGTCRLSKQNFGSKTLNGWRSTLKDLNGLGAVWEVRVWPIRLEKRRLYVPCYPFICPFFPSFLMGSKATVEKIYKALSVESKDVRKVDWSNKEVRSILSSPSSRQVPS
jgi:hypothetical protein